MDFSEFVNREQALREYARWMEGDVEDLFVAKRHYAANGWVFGIAKMSGKKGEKITVQFFGSAASCILATDVEQYDSVMLMRKA